MFLYQLQRVCYYPESYPTMSLLSSLKLFVQWLGVPLPGMLQKGLCSWVNLMTASIPFATKILWFPVHSVSSVQFSHSVMSDSLQPADCSLPGFSVHHQLPELTQTHVHQVGDAIQPSHPLSSPFPPAFNVAQHQGLFHWVSSSHQLAKVLEFQL